MIDDAVVKKLERGERVGRWAAGPSAFKSISLVQVTSFPLIGFVDQ